LVNRFSDVEALGFEVPTTYATKKLRVPSTLGELI
jgi:hypothetical protein